MLRVYRLIKVLTLLSLGCLYGAHQAPAAAIPALDPLAPMIIKHCDLCGCTYMGYSLSQIIRDDSPAMDELPHYLSCLTTNVSPSVAAMLARPTTSPASEVAASPVPTFRGLTSIDTSAACGSAPSGGTPGLSASARAISAATSAYTQADAVKRSSSGK